MTTTRWPRRLILGLSVLLGLLTVLWAVFRTPDVPVAELRAKYGSAASQYVELTPGQTIHLRDEGPRDGFPVVLLHGSNASLHTWEPWVAALSGQYRVVTFDFPGHGLSSPSSNGAYGHDDYARIVEQVVTRLRLAQFALGGNSMGGRVAWTYAHQHPEKVAALILVDAAGPPQRGGSKLPIGFRIARLPVVRELATTITPRSLVESSLRQTVSVQSVVTPAMIDRYWELLRYPGNREATLQRFGQNAEEAASPDGALQVPAAIIWGRDDRLIPLAAVDWFKPRLPNATVTVLDHVGHIPMEEAPAASLAPVRALLDQAIKGRTAAK